MTTATLHPLAADYLKRLSRAGRGLPRARRRELLNEIEAHLTEAIEPEASEAQVRTVLDRLGDPDDIVAAETPGRPAGQRRLGAHEVAAIMLLLFGGFFVGIGWLIGLVFLWTSEAWTTREKWIGTLIIPGGYATTLYVGVSLIGSSSCSGIGARTTHCSNGSGGATLGEIFGFVGFILLVLAPTATAIYLAKRAKAET